MPESTGGRVAGASPIRVLIVDDSAFLRKILGDALKQEKDIEVVATAVNGRVALAKNRDLRPDLVILDVQMPELDGLQTLSELMKAESPPAVLMFSALTREGAELTLRALEAGASDFVCKPQGGAEKIGDTARDLAEKIRQIVRHRSATGRTSLVARVKTRMAVARGRAAQAPVIREPAIVCVGISTGGPAALMKLFAGLDRSAPAMALVQHMPAAFVAPLAARLSDVSDMKIRVASQGLKLEKGVCLVAPGDYQMEILPDGLECRAVLKKAPSVSGHCPSADVLLSTAASAATTRAIGILMTGMGRDGADGMAAIRRCGGRTIAQDESSCTVFGMPRAAIEEGNAGLVLPLDRIAAAILDREKIPG